MTFNSEEFRKQIQINKDFEKLLNRWHKEHGWKDTRRGTCKLCNSTVKPIQEWTRDNNPRMGGPSNSRISTKYFACQNIECGLMYKSPPTPTYVDESIPKKPLYEEYIVSIGGNSK